MIKLKHRLCKMNYDDIYKKVLEAYKPYTKSLNKTQLQDYSQMNNLVNDLAKNENSLKALFDNANYRVLAISNNLEALSGYTQEEFEKNNVYLYLKSISLEHILSPIMIARWGISVFKKVEKLPEGDFTDPNITICGLKMTPKNGKKMRVLLRFTTLVTMDKVFSDIFIVTIDDITHLIKSDFYWGRMEYRPKAPYTNYYSSKEKKSFEQDILSDREKDVLRLIAQGYESKEIGEMLFISTSTVDNHRRNAIARTGAKDTTALIQICTMCNML